MSSTSDAVVSGVSPLDLVFDVLKQRLPAPRFDDARAFAAEFFRRTPEEELSTRPAEAWAGLVIGFLDFARTRSGEAPLVRVYNPTLAEHGWESPHTVLQIVNDDMPFLVDSVSMALAQCDVQVHTLLHPVLQVLRDGRAAERNESLMHVEIERLSEPDETARIAEAVLSALADVRLCVGDWAAMRARMEALAASYEQLPTPVSDAQRAEAGAFLRWIADNHFTFLGFREYVVAEQGADKVLEPVEGTGLGLLRRTDRAFGARPVQTMAAHAINRTPGAVQPLILTKTNSRSTVHRPGYMDYVGVLRFDAQGNAVGELRFIGLFTSSAYNRRPWEIPLVRERFERVMATSQLPADSHSGKALRHILETLPRDELFQSTPDELYRTAMGVLHLQERSRTRLFLREDRFGRFFSALVYIPRDRYNTDVRHRIEALLRDALQGDRIDSTVQMGESPLAQLHLIVRPRAGARVDADVAGIDRRLAQIVRNWHDELRDVLVQRHGEARGLKLASRYGKALPAGYIEDVTPWIAAYDVEQVAALSGPDDLKLSLYRSRRHDGKLRFKLFRRGSDLPLSDVMPLMEAMGLRILTEHPYELRVGEDTVFVQDFEVEPQRGDIDVDAVRERFEAAFERTWRGQAESDGFNRLILGAGLDWRQVATLRGYCKYLLQTGVPFSQTYMEEALSRYPLVARLLVELFEARFDPALDTRDAAAAAAHCESLRKTLSAIASDAQLDGVQAICERLARSAPGDRAAAMEAVEGVLDTLLADVSSIDDDRILRAFRSAIRATLRTNAFQRRDGAFRDWISYKFDPARLPDLPKPRPYREIFVYSPRVEGTHLRFGPVARGGLRWSDRREDFRTEVLGLVKAQMVKNTVIVPEGAKGCFVAKRPPVGGDRDAVLAEGIACYKAFINGLLDVTDNLADGAVVHPQDVVRHDGDDPYLVVAADKGTATFSDIANGISAEHGFWLGDAFASGGSVGYDHKGMGITARGAWESVKRHFRALGRDSQSEDFTCVGIGDMSGDVFGNGMLLSRHIRLVAAFDHRHIFVDPDPQAERSYVERERLFRVPRSSWDDYDKSLISKGGGVFPRSLKSIALSPEMKKALGIDPAVESMTPTELMSAILRAPVDLLWNGGIGTYVKSERETHADVGDRANNALRVNGRELRCRVVGEGGNLGMTQLGRIEAAQVGVLLNTDFIDNSAGVDTSDHEVNIKILLNAAMQRGDLTLEQRNALLVEMTDEVAALVLNDNIRQNQAISLMERMSVARLGSKQHFIRTLESQGLLDRQLEFLPSDAELSERKARGLGLTRPELSILLSYSKMVAFSQLLDSDVPEDPYLSKELQRYFPEALQQRYADLMEGHRLRREIIATAVTNSMVNRMGATFLMRMQEDTGATPAFIAKSYSVAREVLDARALWAAIDAPDLQVPESAQLDALQLIWKVLRGMTRWLLNRPGERRGIAGEVGRYKPGFDALRARLDRVLGAEDRTRFAEDRARWLDLGMPQPLAEQLAALPFLMSALDVVEVAYARDRAVEDVARVYSDIGEALHVSWLLEKIDQLPVEGRWHAHARGVMRDELQIQQSQLVGQVLAAAPSGAAADALVPTWAARDDAALRFTLAMLADMRGQREMDYPTVQVAVRRLAQLVAAGAY